MVDARCRTRSRRATAWAVLAVGLGWALAWGGEVGTRLEVGDRSTGAGWLQLSWVLNRVNLSARLEGDLLCGCIRRVQIGASTAWEGLSTGVEAVALATGRVDLSTTGSWKMAGRTDVGLLSAQVGGKATAVDVLGSRSVMAAGWAFGRLDRDPWWVELSGTVAWPGGSPQGELRLGASGASSATLSISGSGTSLSLGAADPYFFVQTHLSLRPAFQTITVGMEKGRVRVQAKVTVRPATLPAGSLSFATALDPWHGSVLLSLAGAELEKVTVEVRYKLGP